MFYKQAEIMRKLIFTNIVALSLLFLLAPQAMAERSDEFGDYQVHYNALTTDLIEPSVARAYGIIRSKNRALINIAILRKVMGTPAQPVRAVVKVEAVNMSAQLRSIDMRELSDAGAIYYIGEFPVTNRENLTFKFEVTLEGMTTTHSGSFKQEFYTE
ncbi:MAG: hypothetical protein ACI9BW_003417 [Gammaproteobacteria bacterium]|jgi:hypothetical protein